MGPQCLALDEPLFSVSACLCVLQARQLSAMRMQCDAMKKCQDQMLKQIEELLCQKRQLSDRLVGRGLQRRLHLISPV